MKSHFIPVQTSIVDWQLELLSSLFISCMISKCHSCGPGSVQSGQPCISTFSLMAAMMSFIFLFWQYVDNIFLALGLSWLHQASRRSPIFIAHPFHARTSSFFWFFGSCSNPKQTYFLTTLCPYNIPLFAVYTNATYKKLLQTLNSGSCLLGKYATITIELLPHVLWRGNQFRSTSTRLTALLLL